MKSLISRVVVVGGGTAGWMTASALAKTFEGSQTGITLVESDDISSVGVGEATIPSILTFNKILGIDENEFVKATGATFKLGIEFRDWGKIGDSYVHPFGNFGAPIHEVQFYHYWLRAKQQYNAPSLEEFSLACLAARENRFMRPVSHSSNSSPISQIKYAFHFDAGLYAKFLRQYSESKGVTRIEGKIEKVNKRSDNGFIQSLDLANGKQIEGDLFIDCSGFKGLLIGESLGVPFESWADMLPCDKAVVVPTEPLANIPSYTRATAKKAGWQWRIPLQHRTGNGHVFCSQFMSDDEAASELLAGLDTPATADPRFIKFKTGRRQKIWHKNCVSIGLSSGFLEPLESTSIYLIQSAISKLIELFPTSEFSQLEIKKYNELTSSDFDLVRDFIFLHYWATERDDTEFWRMMTSIKPSEHLQEKLDLYRSSGRLYREKNELFEENSWLAVFDGQGIESHGYHPLAASLSEADLLYRLKSTQAVIRKSVSAMPFHQEFIAQHCKSNIGAQQ